MRYFIQYHNVEKLGWVPLDERPFLQTRLAIYTRRALVEKAAGATVFVIASLGSPRRYYLWECFHVERVQCEQGEFCAWGTGWQLVPPQRLAGAEFEAFRRACAWFVGFRDVTDLAYRPTLENLAARFRNRPFDDTLVRFCDELVSALPRSGDVRYFRGYVRLQVGQPQAAADFAEALRLGTEFAEPAAHWLSTLPRQC